VAGLSGLPGQHAPRAVDCKRSELDGGHAQIRRLVMAAGSVLVKTLLWMSVHRSNVLAVCLFYDFYYFQFAFVSEFRIHFGLVL
jgi:hypothetical protein